MILKIIGWVLGVFSIAMVAQFFERGEILAGFICVFAIGFLIPPLREKLNRSMEKKKGNKSSELSLKQGVFGGFFLIFIAFVIGAPEVEATASEQQGKTKVVEFFAYSVSDFELTLNEKQAISVNFGESEDNYCSVTILRKSVKEGYSVKTKKNNDKNINTECYWNGDYYVQSSKHNTYTNFEIERIDQEAGTSRVKITVNLIDVIKDRYLMFENISVKLNKKQTENLLKTS